MSRSSTRKLLTGIVMIALIAGGVLIFQRSPGGDAAAQGQEGEMPAMPVPVLKIEERPVQIWKEFSGRLIAVDYVEIRPQVSGTIDRINFTDGQLVKKGDVLFNIDPRPYEAAVAQAQAEVASAKEDSVFAKKELARAEELLKTGAVSKQGYDQRVNALKVNNSASAAAGARLKAALVDLDRAAIKAPIDGRTSRAEITQGNLVSSANAPILTTIVSDKEIYGDFEVDEQTYLNFVRGSVGQSVESEQSVPVRLFLTNDDKVYQGKIQSFDNRINPSSGTIRARAIFNNSDNTLLPGMFARIEIGSTGNENLITVPEKAVQTDQSRKFVYVAQDGAAAYREVKLGESVDNQRIVLSGLKVGDQVIVDNLMKIRPGAKIQAMSPEQIEAMKKQQAQQGGAPTDAPKEGSEEKPAPEAKAPAGEENPPVVPLEEPDAGQGDAPDAGSKSTQE